MPDRAHILVVEDDPLVSELLVDALLDSYEATAVASAQRGLERLRQGGVNLLLLDCTLPGGLGTELIPEADRTGVPVVLMSGNPAIAGKVPGNRRFLPKPFALPALMEVVAASLPH